jgi:hypothetical protein
LGGDIQIYTIVPGNDVIKAHEHVNHSVLGVKYGPYSFIFPGDAAQNWFSEKCEDFEVLLNQLNGIDFLLLPHHGSMEDTGLFMKDAIEHCNGNWGKTMLCLISSDHNRGSYYMPRYGIHKLFFPDQNGMVREHILPLISVNPVSSELQEMEVQTKCPVFSTAGTNHGYRIICDGSSLQMYRDLGTGKDDKVFDSQGGLE